MSKITIKRTITDHQGGRRFDKDRGVWVERCQHTPRHGQDVPSSSTRRGMRWESEWHEVDGPVTHDYPNSIRGTLGGGTIRTEVTVEGGVENVTLDADQADRVVRSLIAAHHWSNPDVSGMSVEAQREALRSQIAIEGILLLLGADADNLKENL